LTVRITVTFAAALGLLVQGCVTIHVVRRDDESRKEAVVALPDKASPAPRLFSAELAAGTTLLTLQDTRRNSIPRQKVVSRRAWHCEDQWSPGYILAAPLVLALTPIAMLCELVEDKDKRRFLSRGDGDPGPPYDLLGFYLLAGLNPQSCGHGFQAFEDVRAQPLAAKVEDAGPATDEALTVTVSAPGRPERALTGDYRTDAAGRVRIELAGFLGGLSNRPEALDVAVQVAGDPASSFHLSVAASAAGPQPGPEAR
jgi:hypothetical protein